MANSTLENVPEDLVSRLERLHGRMAHLPPVDEEFLDQARREGRR